jgi:hypothetical protein
MRAVHARNRSIRIGCGGGRSLAAIKRLAEALHREREHTCM